MSKRGKTLEGAIEEGLHSLAWRHGVTLVQYDAGSFDSIPPDYLGEAVGAGYEHVEKNLDNLCDRAQDAGLEFPLMGSQVRWLMDRICEETSEDLSADAS